jgi:hypothetical protein
MSKDRTGSETTEALLMTIEDTSPGSVKLRERILELESLLSGSHDELFKAMALVRELQENVAFLESREVCGAAHDNVEACGYCQRDGLIGLVQLLSYNEDIPKIIRSNMLMNHRYIAAVGFASDAAANDSINAFQSDGEVK